MAAAPIDPERSDARLLGYCEQVYLNAFKLEPDAARVMAETTSHWLRKIAGGQSIYIPAADVQQRNQAIRAQWTGSNALALSKAYGISKRHVERIVHGWA